MNLPGITVLLGVQDLLEIDQPFAFYTHDLDRGSVLFIRIRIGIRGDGIVLGLYIDRQNIGILILALLIRGSNPS